MRISSRQLYEELKKIKSDVEIFKGCEFSKERFMRNLEKEESGEIDQLVIKQNQLLQVMAIKEMKFMPPMKMYI